MKHNIQLNDKELFSIWMIITWFNRPLMTTKLKHKVSGLAKSDYRDKHYDKTEQQIMDKIISLGKWLEEKGYGSEL